METASVGQDRFQRAIWVVRIQDGRTWDFGTVVTENIKIVAETIYTDWCYQEAHSHQQLLKDLALCLVERAFTYTSFEGRQ